MYISKNIKTWFLISFCISLALPTVAGDEIWEEPLKKFIEVERQKWDVPGLAVAVVKDGGVVFSEGFGYRNLEKKLPATSDTLFAIGSCSKAITATAMAILVDQGKVSWTDRVSHHLPGFRLKDEFATARMTPIDLMCHRSGLPRHDLMWYGSDFTREELFQRLQYLEPSEDFRTVFQYNNLMFMTAGYLIGHASGGSWETFVSQYLLKPLDMTRSNFSVDISQKDDNYSLPYEKEDGKIQAVPFRVIDAVGPAGSINSSVNEMANWVLMNLAKGKWDQSTVVSEENLGQVHTPQITTGGAHRHPELSYGGYALGWAANTYRGHHYLSHGGGIDGFISKVGFFPRDGFGYVVLTNSGTDGSPFSETVARHIMDLVLEKEPVDWSGRFKKEMEKPEEAKKEGDEGEQGDEGRIANTSPSHGLNAFLGEFNNPGYGVATVTRTQEGLNLKFHSFLIPLEHWHYNVFNATDKVFDGQKVSFLSGEDGHINSLSMSLEAAVDPVVFTKLAPSKLKDPQYLAQLVGEYDLNGVLTKIRQEPSGLVLKIEGQPLYHLEAFVPDEFKVKSLKGFTIRFNRENNVVVSLTSVQPNGSFVAKKK